MVVGFATFGMRIVHVLGVDLARLSPTRGFAVELATAAVTLVGTRLSIPLSTTQCVVRQSSNQSINRSISLSVDHSVVVTAIFFSISILPSSSSQPPV